jgi:ABC-type antimicrobial peptide transport system permease subunit
MKNIKGFEEFANESIFGNVARLGLGDRPNTKNKIAGRQDDDNYAVEIYNDMINDFNKNGKDLRKVNMMSDHHISYVFGEFDTIKNSPLSGNEKVGNKKITITYIPAKILVNRNSLEKTFGVSSGLKLAKGRIKIKEILENPNYAPNYHPDYKKTMGEDFTDSERNMMRMYDRKEEEFKITYDLAKDFCDYFLKEYNKQYPQLKNAKHRNTWSINEIEKGKKPTLGYVDVFDKNNNEIIYNYDDVKNKKKIENYIKNHICVKGRNEEGYPITYFLSDDETVEEIEKKMETLSREEVDKQNMERVLSYR